MDLLLNTQYTLLSGYREIKRELIEKFLPSVSLSQYWKRLCSLLGGEGNQKYYPLANPALLQYLYARQDVPEGLGVNNCV